MFPRSTFLPAAALLAFCVSASHAAHVPLTPADLEFFESKVRPLLVERCLDCHSAEKKVKGGLRLDTREGWAKGGDSGPAIVPGDPGKSMLVTAVRYTDRDLQMPEKNKLPDAEIAILEKWVQMGAPDPRLGETATKQQTGLTLEEGRKFWAYAAPKQSPPPPVQDATWPRTGLDHFVLSKIEAAGLQPAPDARAEALVRRLHFNLVGLPPTPEEIDAFSEASQNSPQAALEKAVDQLLASPRFGETWGRRWLDVARFAESSGGGRTLLFKDAWRYRDYVIESFNADVPFDRFIREQLAGDLLPAATPADARRQLTATAFLALGPTNYEEQDKQQLRFDVIDEQLDTLGRAFLGQTIGCARCHDHKFDPIPQRDYYAMAGILASTRTLFDYEENVARWIAAPLPSDGPAEAALRDHEGKVAALQKDLSGAKAELAALSKAVTQEAVKPGLPVAPSELPGIVIDDAQAKLVGEWKHSTFVRSYVGAGYVHDLNAGKGEKTITFTPTLPKADRYEVRLAYAHASGRASNVRVNVLHADGEDTVFVDQTQAPPIDGRFVSLGKYRFEKEGAGYVLISNDDANGFVTVDALQFISESEAAKKDQSADAANPLRADVAQRVKKLEAQLKQLNKEGPVRETAMAVREDDQIADAQIRVRGVEKQRGETVPRGFLRVALTGETKLPSSQSGRRELADWIAAADNPLTARVFVNRVWTWLFGAGLVRTVDNFGTTGELPSHPELLDDLAVQFVAQGWSTKRLVREIVLSRTWQQSVRSESAEDPENRLFTHANRRRLDAEQIRDTLLSVSGQLKLDYGGLNIIQAGEINPNDFSAQNVEYGYVFADTRRSVYTPAFRNKRLELFEVFDFSDINASMGQRNVSTVAPQALFFLNHPFVLEQARAAAERGLGSNGDDAGRISTAFRRTLGRLPTSAELEKCRRFLGPNPTIETWAQFHQTLFACVDFRYLD
ncbi:MAG: xly [Chthoniobacter sp.]|nr:xly [Chthoniobacter sp.]